MPDRASRTPAVPGTETTPTGGIVVTLVENAEARATVAKRAFVCLTFKPGHYRAEQMFDKIRQQQTSY